MSDTAPFGYLGFLFRCCQTLIVVFVITTRDHVLGYKSCCGGNISE